ncbi:type IV fimbrial biogenesis protein FimT [Acidovorax sp. 93]|uniref:GspH/FimT family pseudopilin n=1 Tax=Acidovorax sp. 93 TaxID=2135632 RepID=UPI000EB5F498|nr:GspH/FimT family pseudopilin [Acidovorax sp. 93]RKR26810.1 type IV fimbrial biogenesis protein FimT [Acidovorax sp. 93]
MLHTSSLSHTRRQSGFTFIEVLVVVSVLGILAALALPSFQPLIERWRVKTTVEELQSSLYFARSRAITNGGNIVLAKNDVFGSCVSTGNDDWTCGWRIYFDANRDGNQAACTPADTTECTIQESTAAPNTLLVVAPNDNGRLFMDGSGRITNKAGVVFNNLSMDIVAKDRMLTDLSSRRLCIFGPGRYKQVKGSESC